MRKERKEEDSAMLVRHRTDSATLTFLSEGQAEGERWERRGPYENESHKVLNLDFYSVVSNTFSKVYNLQSAKSLSARTYSVIAKRTFTVVRQPPFPFPFQQ